jgi:beta-lactamase class D
LLWYLRQQPGQVYIKRFRDTGYLPASTFKIFNALSALATGRIFSDTVVVPWDGVVRTGRGGDTMYQWNKSMNMREAFEVSNVGFFQEMARRIGRDTMQKMLDSFSYGNKKIGPAIDRFWLDNSLKITADEQMGLVKKLYFDQLNFQKREMAIVRDLMLREQTDKYTLAYKTGWGQTENGHQLGWMVGWIEENRHPYIFSLNFETPDSTINLPELRLRLFKTMMAEMGFFEGKK